MKLSKKQRAALREKFGGRCAYCGEELGDRWHADHIENVERELAFVPGKGITTTGRMLKPERDTLENMNPACAPCNLDKHSLTLDAWRALMQRSNEVLMRDVSTFRRAVRYGLVELKATPIVFYFERAQAHKEST
ncbi:HNH endonuclease [Delftia acidovorans]|uniref:HNH endonuclease n=1 Tax=Delftia acidovorans TaxID=80866 RepID=UPI0018E7E807|nr:HNH endonuclease signature motif containing protein [Delftia acidovorans]MBJ2139859.1 HNH endonuclease [Delftia acidovorans]